MHVNPAQQFQSFVYISCILQHIVDGRCCGKVGFTGTLMCLNRVACHQIGYGKTLLVDTVECEEQTRQTHILVFESLRLEVITESVELHIERGDGFITLFGNRVKNNTCCRREVEVAPH